MNLKNALKPSLLALMFIYGCDSTPKVKTTNVSTTDQSDIMDVSTWDFGDKPYSDNLAEEQNREEFAIVIATFTGVGHDINANKTLSTLAMQYPKISHLHRHNQPPSDYSRFAAIAGEFCVCCDATRLS